MKITLDLPSITSKQLCEVSEYFGKPHKELFREWIEDGIRSTQETIIDEGRLEDAEMGLKLIPFPRHLP